MASAAGVAATYESNQACGAEASQWPLRPVSLRRGWIVFWVVVDMSQWPLRPVSLRL